MITPSDRELLLRKAQIVATETETAANDANRIGTLFAQIIQALGDGATEADIRSLINELGQTLFLSKVNADTAAALISFMNGIIVNGLASIGKDSTSAEGVPVLGVGSDETQVQHEGFGGWVDRYGNANFKSITAREFLATHVFRFNKIQVTEGEQWDTNAFGSIRSVAIASGSNQGIAVLELDPKEWASIREGDICRGIFNVFDGMTADMLEKYQAKTGVDITDNPDGYQYGWQLPDAYDDTETYAVGDSVTYDGYIWRCSTAIDTAEDFDEDHWTKTAPVARGVDAAGFPLRSGYFTTYFVVTHVDNTVPGTCTFEYEVRNGYPHPCAGMKFAQYGSVSDPSRRASRMRVVSPQAYEQVLTDVSSWAYSSANVAIVYGWLEGLIVKVWQRIGTTRTGTAVDTTLHGFGFYTRENIYFGEAIQQIDPAIVEEFMPNVAEYTVDLSEHVDTITVDSVGNVIQGLYTETTEGGTTVRTWRLQTSVSVRKNGTLLTLASGSPGEGTFSIVNVQGVNCTAVLTGSVLTITAISNILDGVSETADNLDFDAMRAMENCRIDFVVNCEGSAMITKSFPVSIKHVEQPYISAALSNPSVSCSWNTKAQHWIGLPVGCSLKMWRTNTSNNAALALTGLSIYQKGSATVLAGIVKSGDTIQQVGNCHFDSTTDTAGAGVGWKFTIATNADGLPTGEVTIQDAPTGDGSVELELRATTSYAGVSYERASDISVSKRTDVNVYEIWPSQTVLVRKYNTSGKYLDIENGVLTCIVSCDSENNEHYQLTASQMTAAGLAATYVMYNASGQVLLQGAYTIGTTTLRASATGADGEVVIPSACTKIVFSLNRGTFLEDTAPVEISEEAMPLCHVVLYNDTDSVVYDSKGRRIGNLPSTTTRFMFGETNLTADSGVTWAITGHNCTVRVDASTITEGGVSQDVKVISVTGITGTADIYVDVKATYLGEEYTRRFSISYVTNAKSKYWLQLSRESVLWDKVNNIVDGPLTITAYQWPSTALGSDTTIVITAGHASTTITSGTTLAVGDKDTAGTLSSLVHAAISAGETTLTFTLTKESQTDSEVLTVIDQGVDGADGAPGSNGADAIVYSIDPSVSTIHVDSDTHKVTMDFTANIFKRQGDGGIESATLFSVLMARKGTTRTRLAYGTIHSYSISGLIWCDDPTDSDYSARTDFESLEIFAWKDTAAYQAATDPYTEFLAKVEIPVVTAGGMGPMLYPAGEWSSGTTYSVSSDGKQVPYVVYNGLYYYLVASSASGSSQAPGNTDYWKLMTQIDVIFAKFGIVDYGKMASAIFCGDWMYSQYGKLHVYDYSTSTLTTYIVDGTSSTDDSGHIRYDEQYNGKVPYAFFNPAYPDGAGPTTANYVLFEPEYAVDFKKGTSYMNAAVLKSGFFTGFRRVIPTDINPSNIAVYLNNNGWIEAGTSAVPGATPVASNPTPRLDLNRVGSSIFLRGTMTADYCIHLPFIWADPSGNTFASQVESAGKDVIRELMRVRSYVGEEIEIINLTDETVRIVGMISSITGITHGWNGSTWTAGAPWQTFFLASGCMIRLRCSRKNTFTNPFASNSDAAASNERVAWDLIAILKDLDSTNSYDPKFINSIDE